jgi:hypothetical protein
MKRALALMALLLAAPSLWAGQQNAVRSCYEIAKLAQRSAPVDTALFVAIDQTTPLDDNLQRAVAANIQNLLRPGNSFAITRFAAFTQGYYTEVLVSGRLDAQLSQNVRDDISKPLLAGFDNCMKYQLPFAGKLERDALQQAFAGISGSIAKSDVLASLKEISGPVRQMQAQRKLVLVVSDMLENSSVSSFYANQAVRRLDVQKELKLAGDARLFGDFGGAKVYVIGAGLLDDSSAKAKNAYRDPKTMQALADFWRAYFQQSNAELVEFGQPALLSPMQ